MYKIATLFLVAAISTAYGQVISTGSCPDTAGIADFNITSYLGVWYQIAAYPAAFQGGDCTTANYTLQADGSTATVVNKEVVLGIEASVEGTAVVSSDDGTGELAVTINYVTAPYIILDTDYTDYAIVYSCTDVLGVVKAEFAWILSRTSEQSSAAATYVSEYLPTSPIDSTQLDVTDQSDCSY